MASSLLQVRIDDDLKSEASALYEQLGIDLPTAVRIFIKRSVMVQGIPFSMTLSEQDTATDRAVRAMKEMSAAAEKAGVADMSLEEINREIHAARATRAIL